MEKEITTNLTFSGKEAEKITIKELEEWYKLISAGGKPVIAKILENLSMEKSQK